MAGAYRPDQPLIVQADRTLLLEVDNPRYAECRDRLAAFAELRKSPEHIHFYGITAALRSGTPARLVCPSSASSRRSSNSRNTSSRRTFSPTCAT